VQETSLLFKQEKVQRNEVAGHRGLRAAATPVEKQLLLKIRLSLNNKTQNKDVFQQRQLFLTGFYDKKVA
jgi:hypothetical protein